MEQTEQPGRTRLAAVADGRRRPRRCCNGGSGWPGHSGQVRARGRVDRRRGGVSGVDLDRGRTYDAHTHRITRDPRRPDAGGNGIPDGCGERGEPGRGRVRTDCRVSNGAEADVAAAVGIGSVVAAWLIVHTVFALRYARLYYQEPTGGIDFNQDDGTRYVDFAYLAFTLGMTYQVSDTDLQTRSIRGHRASSRAAVLRARRCDPGSGRQFDCRDLVAPRPSRRRVRARWTAPRGSPRRRRA